MSSIDIFLLLWFCASVNPADYQSPGRDRIIVSHGHTAAGVYAALAQAGFVDRNEVIAGFRRAHTRYEGHPSQETPGVEWCSGNLGQGLSVGCGFAWATRFLGLASRTFVVMGDGEQQKGQIAEARRFASKYRLTNLIAVIDRNDYQASGSVERTMPVNIAAEYSAAGWEVMEVDGHDFAEMYQALRCAYSSSSVPTVLICRTVMGRGVSFIENRFEFHGQPLLGEQLEQALGELGQPRELPQSAPEHPVTHRLSRPLESEVSPGLTRLYPADSRLDCRSAIGRALLDVADANEGDIPLVVIDCDLSASVKTRDFALKHPNNFIQCGICEHHAATLAASLSKAGVVCVLAEFGVFALYEALNQLRMADINGTSLKIICTHCGLDVGEDGKTHQCMDYIGLVSTLHHFKLLIPADPNQADRMCRFALTTPGNVVIATGRSPVPVLADEIGTPVFAGAYQFVYGKADWLRRGDDAVIATCGGMVYRALAAAESLRDAGVEVGVINIPCPLEIDRAALGKAASTGLILTYEDHNKRGGLGSTIGAYLAEERAGCQLVRLGATSYGRSGKPEELLRLQKLSVDSLREMVLLHVNKRKR